MSACPLGRATPYAGPAREVAAPPEPQSTTTSVGAWPRDQPSSAVLTRALLLD